MRPLPPTKIQISVLDVVPAVWASAFVERREFKKKVRHSLNTGEFFLSFTSSYETFIDIQKNTIFSSTAVYFSYFKYLSINYIFSKAK